MSGFALHPSDPLVLEGGLFGLLLAVFLIGLFRREADEPLAGWVTLAGLLGLSFAAWTAEPGRTALQGSFVLDELSLFAKRLFLVSGALCVLATLAMTHVSFRRRGASGACSGLAWAGAARPRGACSRGIRARAPTR